MIHQFFCRAALVAVLACGLADRPVLAAQTIVLAEGWSVRRLFDINNRTRVVQFAAAAMALALFILMKKFVDTDSGQPTASPASPPPADSPSQAHPTLTR